LQNAYFAEGNASTPAELLDTSAKILAEVSRTDDPHTAGLLATLLSRTPDVWKPSAKMLAKLEQVCSDLLDGDPNMIGVVEPLVFALACHNRRAQHRKYLETVLCNDAWRTEDISRIGEYYEDRWTQVEAMRRHLKDKQRSGLLGANDICRLLNLLRIVEPKLAVDTVLPMLQEAIEIIQTAGEETLAKHAMEDCADTLASQRMSQVVLENLPH
jgi:hypothetical protein